MRHAAAAQGRSNYPRLRLAVRPTHYEVLFVVFYPVKTHTDLQAPAPLPSSSRSFNKAVGVPPRRDACSTSARTSRHACRTTPYYIPDLNPPNRYSHQLSQASALLDPPDPRSRLRILKPTNNDFPGHPSHPGHAAVFSRGLPVLVRVSVAAPRLPHISCRPDSLVILACAGLTTPQQVPIPSLPCRCRLLRSSDDGLCWVPRPSHTGLPITRHVKGKREE